VVVPDLQQDGTVLDKEVLHEEVGSYGRLVVQRERLVDVLEAHAKIKILKSIKSAKKINKRMRQGGRPVPVA
jgi:hypothetical protein